MKRVLLLLGIGALLTCPALAQQTGTTVTPTQQPQHPGGGHMTKEEHDELKAARDAALKADPGLEAEGKELHDKVNAYEKKVGAAMIKADSKVAPLVEKMEQEHAHHGGPGGPGGGPGGPPPAN